MDVSDSNFRIGFMRPPTLLSGQAESWVSLPASIGRFELLRIEKFADGSVKTKRIPLDSCDGNPS
jgi:hypothetical protein